MTASEPIQVETTYEIEGEVTMVFDPHQGQLVPLVNETPAATPGAVLAHLGVHPDQAIRVTQGTDQGAFVSARLLAQAVWFDALWRAMQLPHGEILELLRRGGDGDDEDGGEGRG